MGPQGKQQLLGWPGQGLASQKVLGASEPEVWRRISLPYWAAYERRQAGGLVCPCLAVYTLHLRLSCEGRAPSWAVRLQCCESCRIKVPSPPICRHAQCKRELVASQTKKRGWK